MKVVSLLVMLLGVVGCQEREAYTPQGGNNFDLRELCLNGVVYYSGVRKLVPAFKPDGSLYTCDVGSK